MSNEEIGQLTHYSAIAIDCYERAFFDVRCRLDHRSIILNLATDAVPATSAPPILREIRGLSYFGGPHIAKMLHALCPTRARLTTRAEIHRFLERDIDDDLLVKSTLALRTLDTSCPRARRVIMRLELNRRRIEQRQLAQRHEYDQLNQTFRDSIRACLQQLPASWLSQTAQSAAQVA